MSGNKKFKLGFIGVGNMGGALLDACLKKVSGENIAISDFNTAKTAYYEEKYGVSVMPSEETAARSEYLFICVKPQMAEELFRSVRPELDAKEEKPVLVSIMAGVTIERVIKMAGEMPVIRIMPNVAASVGCAMILCDSHGVSDSSLECFRDFMSEAGRIDMLPEKLIDAGSAVTGCAPAFVCMFIEAMADGAVKCGIPRAKALEYAEMTLYGTAELLLKTGKHPAVVKDEVTSPAGTTIEGVKKLEDGGMRAAVIEAVCASYEKNKKL